MIPWLVLLTACDATGDSGTPDAGAVEAVPYIYESDDTAAATLSLTDLELRVADALAGAWSIEATPVFSAYVEIMTSADGYCPNYYDYNGSEYWYDDCTSDAGAAFSGYAFYSAYNGNVIDGLIYNGGALYGVGAATAVDGSRLEFGGSASSYTAIPDGLSEDDPNYYVYGVSQVQGGFSYDGPSAEGWLADGEAPDIAAVSYYVPSYDGRYAWLDGSVGGSEGGATVFDGLALYSENLMPSCPNEPYGGISVRDDQGEWYDIIFHGPETFESEVDTSLCDGCGDAYFHGELMGQVCADFSGLTDWEVTPWAE